MLNITILDGYTVTHKELNWDMLSEFGTVTVYDNTNPSDVIERSKDADIVLTNKVCFGKNEIEQLPRLKYIGVLATGYNVVDLASAREHGVIVTNVPAYSTNSVAQIVFAHLLNVSSNVAHYVEENRRGRWAKESMFCYMDGVHHELAGKTFGIVGLGNIGIKVAEIAHAFGLKVCAVTSKPQEALPEYITACTREVLFATADIISLHCPLTEDTREMISAKTLDKVRPETIIINTGRGPLVNEQDVADALREGRIAAYCADVLSVEPASPDNPLLTAPNVFLTPHIAWATLEARQRLQQTVLDNIKAFVSGNPINVVN